jgi:lipopolysaccharide biosynthesis regulator YciM
LEWQAVAEQEVSNGVSEDRERAVREMAEVLQQLEQRTLPLGITLGSTSSHVSEVKKLYQTYQTVLEAEEGSRHCGLEFLRASVVPHYLTHFNG